MNEFDVKDVGMTMFEPLDEEGQKDLLWAMLDIMSYYLGKPKSDGGSLVVSIIQPLASLLMDDPDWLKEINFPMKDEFLADIHRMRIDWEARKGKA